MSIYETGFSVTARGNAVRGLPGEPEANMILSTRQALTHRPIVSTGQSLAGAVPQLLQASNAALRDIDGPLQPRDFVGRFEVAPLDRLLAQTCNPVDRVAQVLFESA
jgi:hypothetical protein